MGWESWTKLSAPADGDLIAVQDVSDTTGDLRHDSQKSARGYSFGVVMMIKRFLMVLAIVLLAASSWAAEVNLAWDPPDAGTPTGYKIYWGKASGAYTENLDVGAVTAATVPDLTNGKTYFFAATAYYEDGSESGYSNEVSKFLPELLPPGGLKITGIKLNIELQGE